MEEKLYSSEEVADILKMTTWSIHYRSENLGIKRIKQKGQRGFFFTKEHLNLITEYKYKQKAPKGYIYSSEKIKIVEYFIKNKSNSTEEISKILNIKIQKVHYAINEYLENKTITVISKL